jgi:peroxiredoxin Q/BCP
MSNALEVGSVAPGFSTLAVGGEFGDGKRVALSDFLGRPVVLYFYPKDDTPGCTTQACGIRDGWEAIKERAVVFGVSTDSASSHLKFIKKYSLPFALLADESKEIVSAYGVWVEKSMYGKKYMGTERTTFVIGANGTLLEVLRKVKPAEHLDLVLAALP